MSQSLELPVNRTATAVTGAGTDVQIEGVPEQALPTLPTLGLRVRPQRSLWGNAWRQFRKHKLAMAGLITFIFLLLATFVGSPLYPQEIDAIDFSVSGSGISMAHPMGTDSMGQDI